jgi:hypothetical protein
MEAASFSAALTAVQSAIHDLLSTIKENAADAARYLSTADPLSAAIFLLAFFIFYCWVVSIITGNYSQVRSPGCSVHSFTDQIVYCFKREKKKIYFLRLFPCAILKENRLRNFFF